MSTSSEPALEPSLIECPFPVYAQLREHAPVAEMAPGVYMITRYEDVLRVVKDTATFSSRAPRNPFSWFGEPERQDELDEILRRCPEIPTLLDNDPPEQTRVRALVAKVFNEANVASLEPAIAELIDELSSTWIGRRGWSSLRNSRARCPQASPHLRWGLIPRCAIAVCSGPTRS
ncbi:hypothetical protein N602_25775 [Mycobacterium avium subsp. hominissuis 10-5606]|nr:hypothetical protein N602_25775 [Mycobacterium avium subsp. hominissuis 10-5606]